MNNPTDTNQASEELDDILRNLSWVQHELGTKGLIPLSKHEYEAKAKIESLIRTEKLKLLAEVRERVVGEGELVDAEILKKFYDKAYSNGFDDKGYENSYNSQDYRSAEDIAPVIAKIRGGNEKRFAALTKLEAEL